MLDIKRALDPKQHHESGQIRAGPGLPGNGVMADDGSDVPGFRYGEQMTPPPAEQASEAAITRFEHVYEVDPRPDGALGAPHTFPNWDTLRIMNSRHDHLAWMHDTSLSGRVGCRDPRRTRRSAHREGDEP